VFGIVRNWRFCGLEFTADYSIEPRHKEAIAMARRWLKLYYDMKDHAIMQDDWLCRLWVWCLFSANFGDSKFKGETVKRGSFVTGRNSGSQQLNVSPSKFYRGLEKLAELGCINVQANNNWTTVTVCNYTTYQDRQESERTASEQRMNNERTTDEQQKNTSIEDLEYKSIRDKELNTLGSRASEEKKEPEQAKPASQEQPLLPAHAVLEDAFRSTFKPLALVPLPDVLETPAFRETWSKWCDYMTREKAIRYAQTTIQAHLSDLARDGPTTAANRLLEAMAIGLISPVKRPLEKKSGNGKHSQDDWRTKARAKHANTRK
jgi:hypothetical protein